MDISVCVVLTFSVLYVVVKRTVSSREVEAERVGSANMRRSSRLSNKSSPEQKPARRASDDPMASSKNKRPKREAAEDKPSTPSSPSDSDPGADEADVDVFQPPLETGPSAYELARLEKIKKNAMVMESLGLTVGATGIMRAAVKSDAVKKKNAGISLRQPKSYPTRRRESARVRGKTPEGLPMEDPEEAFNIPRLQRLRRLRAEAAGVIVGNQLVLNGGTGVIVRDQLGSNADEDRPRLMGDVFMGTSEASADNTRRLRKMMGDLDSRDEGDGGAEKYDLAEPGEILKRLSKLRVEEADVGQVGRDRAYSLSWFPSKSKLFLAVGDKAGNICFWSVDGVDCDMNTSSQEGAGVFRYKPHTGAVARLTFDALDGNKLISTSYDGTARRMDVDKGAFEQVYATGVSDGAYLTDGHLMAEERTLLLSDSVGDITAVDLRTNKQAWKREAHEKKANTVHTHPSLRHLFVTASLDRSVKLWEARNLGPETGSSMKPVAEMEHFRSVNSAHFSPGGEWVVSVAQDNKLRLYRDLALASGKVGASQVLPHDNITGRWLTKFQASWDPKSRDIFAIGSMQRSPRRIHLYSAGNGDDKTPSKVEIGEDGFVSSVQSVIAFHPSRDVLAGANASGRVHIFR